MKMPTWPEKSRSPLRPEVVPGAVGCGQGACACEEPALGTRPRACSVTQEEDRKPEPATSCWAGVEGLWFSKLTR